jgi:hypothetical protein
MIIINADRLLVNRNKGAVEGMESVIRNLILDGELQKGMSGNYPHAKPANDAAQDVMGEIPPDKRTA